MGNFLQYDPRFLRYPDSLRPVTGVVTFTNVQMDEFYSVVEEISDSENDGIALEMLYEAIEFRLQQRWKKMNAYVADNFKAVVLRGITSGRISATLEEDVLKRYVANVNLVVTELDATSSSEDDTAPNTSDAPAAGTHNDQSIGSMPSDGRLVCYTDDDNGSVVPRWNGNYVPVFAQPPNSQSDLLETIAESSSEESIDLLPVSNLNRLETVGTSNADCKDSQDLLPETMQKTNSSGVDNNSETAVDYLIVKESAQNYGSSNIKESYASGSFISCMQDLTNPALLDDDLSVSFVSSPNGSEYLSDSDISFSDHISGPISSYESSACSEVENPHKNGIAERIVNRFESDELDATSAELHCASRPHNKATIAPPISSEATSELKCGTSAFRQTPAKNNLSKSSSDCTDDLDGHSSSELKERKQTSVTASSSANMEQATFESRIESPVFLGDVQRPRAPSFPQLFSCQDTQSKAVTSCSTSVQPSAESGSSNTASNQLPLKSCASRFAFFNKKKKSEIVTPRDMATTSVRRSLSSVDQLTSSNSPDICGNHDGSLAVEPATQSEPIFTPHKSPEQDERVERTVEITQSHLPGCMPQWSPHHRLEAKRNCDKQWGHLKNLPKILFSLWSFERRRPKAHTLGQLFGSLKAETEFGSSVEKLFGSQAIFRAIFPSFYEKMLLEEADCFVLKDHVAQLKFAEVEEYTMEDIVHQTFESAGKTVMGVDELCSLVKYQVSDVINSNSEFIGLRACYAPFVDEIDATKRSEIILTAVNKHPELFKYSRPMRKVHLNEEVVVVNTSKSFSNESNL